jgi:D-alanine transaminase
LSPEPLCLVGGELVPVEAARISPLDRGFLFGDAVYEAMKVRRGKILFLAPHLARLARSLAALRIPEPPAIAAALERLRAAAGLASGSLYLQISRGAAPTRSHLPPAGLAPTLFAMAVPLDFAARPWELPGLAATSRADDRWRRCDVKTTALAASVLGKLDAADAGAVESLFVGDDGAVREGGNTNFFARDAAGWHTHPLGPEILSGVTRAIVIDAARAAGIEIAERAPRLERRVDWLEACLAGTTTGVRGVTTLDGAPVADGAVGEGTRELARRLDAAERSECGEVAA